MSCAHPVPHRRRCHPALAAAALLTTTLLGVAAPADAAAARCGGVKATIVGTAKSETIKGTAKRDVIVAKGGNDRIDAGPGNDVVHPDSDGAPDTLRWNLEAVFD